MITSLLSITTLKTKIKLSFIFLFIWDTSNVTLNLNGKPLPSLTVVYELKDYRDENQICCVNAPSPCVVELINQHGKVSSGESCVSFNVTQTGFAEDINLTLTYYVCSVIGEKITLTFRSHGNFTFYINLYMHIYTHMCVCVRACACVCVCVRSFVCVRMYLCVCTCHNSR